MRPILVNIPAKLLFVAALVLAVAGIVRDLVRRRRDPTLPLSSTPLYLLIGAEILIGIKSGSWIPSLGGFQQAWTPVPIYSYGVMLGTSLMVGLAPGHAPREAGRHRPGGSGGHLHVDGDLVDHRLARAVVDHDPRHPGVRGLLHQPRWTGRVRRHDRRVPRQLVRMPQARDPAAALGRRGRAVGGAGHGDHARGLPAVRVRFRAAIRRSLGDLFSEGAARPGITTSTIFGLGQGCGLVVPGASDADLRVAGRVCRSSAC